MHGGNVAAQRPPRHPFEPGLAQGFGKPFRCRKPADRFDQIPIGLVVAGDGSADLRDDVPGIDIVDAIEAGNIHMREFQAQEPAAGL